MDKAENIEVDITCDTSELDSALEKTKNLADSMNELSPQVNIRNCRGCTFNIYPTRTWINESGGIG